MAATLPYLSACRGVVQHTQHLSKLGSSRDGLPLTFPAERRRLTETEPRDCSLPVTELNRGHPLGGGGDCPPLTRTRRQTENPAAVPLSPDCSLPGWTQVYSFCSCFIVSLGSCPQGPLHSKSERRTHSPLGVAAWEPPPPHEHLPGCLSRAARGGVGGTAPGGIVGSTWQAGALSGKTALGIPFRSSLFIVLKRNIRFL